MKERIEMKYTQGFYPIIGKENLSRDIFSLTICCHEISSLAVPGQFVHIALPGHSLRRPISISSIDREAHTIRIIFAVKGTGTKDLSCLNVGNTIDIVGPLGNGFTLLGKDKKVILIGGGIGTPPMAAMASYYGENAHVISGFRDKTMVILQDEFKRYTPNTYVCTEDGSEGIKGFVTMPLEELLKKEHFDMVYACGPIPMLKAVALVTERFDTPCEVSMEQHMGCGIGACLVCTCKIKTEHGIDFRHVCKNGPVFDAREVEWNG